MTLSDADNSDSATTTAGAPYPQRLTLEIGAEPSSVPVEVRVKRALKILLRTCQLRCERIEVPANKEQS